MYVCMYVCMFACMYVCIHGIIDLFVITSMSHSQLMRSNPEKGAQFASSLVKEEPPLASIQQVADVFMEGNLIQPLTGAVAALI